MKAKFSLYVIAIALIAVLTLGVGCTKAPNDAQLTSDIQNKLVADSGLQGKQLGVKAEDGTVTLTGTVDNDAQREAAARYAAVRTGVKQVINNLQVAASAASRSRTDRTAGRRDQTFAGACPGHKPRHRARERSLPSSSSGNEHTSGADDCHDRSACGTGNAAASASTAEGHDSFGDNDGGALGRHD